MGRRNKSGDDRLLNEPRQPGEPFHPNLFGPQFGIDIGLPQQDFGVAKFGLVAGTGLPSMLLEAEASVRAGRETLRSTEISVLNDTVAAYMDVVRDQAILRVRGAGAQGRAHLNHQKRECCAASSVGVHEGSPRL